jgi:uncharacterized glyoxalase superfamily protein PhnB
MAVAIYTGIMVDRSDLILYHVRSIAINKNASKLCCQSIVVTDVDATYKRAIAAGAMSVQEPIKKDDEDKRGGVKDAGGTTWWIATLVE